MTATLSGIGAAVPTFRAPSGGVDAPLQEALAHYLAAQGADLLLVAGTTGRGGTLDEAHRVHLVAASVPSGVLVVCGVPHIVSDTELVRLASAGAAAVLVAFDPTVGFSAAMELVVRARSTGVEPIAYHHPTHHDPLPVDWYRRLAAAQVAVKNSDSNLAVCHAMCDAGLRVFIGATALLAPMGGQAAGALSGLGAVAFPQVRSAVAGDEAAQADLLDLEARWSGDRIGEVERRARAAVAGPYPPH